jgi:hypothetical protein
VESPIGTTRTSRPQPRRPDQDTPATPKATARVSTNQEPQDQDTLPFKQCDHRAPDQAAQPGAKSRRGWPPAQRPRSGAHVSQPCRLTPTNTGGNVAGVPTTPHGARSTRQGQEVRSTTKTTLVSARLKRAPQARSKRNPSVTSDEHCQHRETTGRQQQDNEKRTCASARRSATRASRERRLRANLALTRHMSARLVHIGTRDASTVSKINSTFTGFFDFFF